MEYDPERKKLACDPDQEKRSKAERLDGSYILRSNRDDLSVLAYHLLVAIEKTLLDQGVHTSWATVRETLRTHQVCTVVLPANDGSVLRIRRDSTPEPEHVELYERLAVPARIMTPRKTWSDAAGTG